MTAERGQAHDISVIKVTLLIFKRKVPPPPLNFIAAVPVIQQARNRLHFSACLALYKPEGARLVTHKGVGITRNSRHDGNLKGPAPKINSLLHQCNKDIRNRSRQHSRMWKMPQTEAFL